MANRVEAASTSPAERRTSPRQELEVEVGFESEHNFYTGLTQDISGGGLFVATHQIRHVGEHVKVTFTLPGGKVIAVETEVRWVRESSALRRADGAHGMGLRFLELPEDAKTAIGKFISQRDSLFYDDE